MVQVQKKCGIFIYNYPLLILVLLDLLIISHFVMGYNAIIV